MSTRNIIIVVALLVAAGIGGIIYAFAPELFREEPAVVEQPEPAADAVAIAEEPAAAAPDDSDLIPPSFDIIRVEPSGEVLAAGRAAPGAAVELVLEAKAWGVDTTNADGEWAIVPASPLSVGKHEVLLRATGAHGQGGPIEGDRATIVIDDGDDVPVIALARPGESFEIVQQPEEVVVAAADGQERDDVAESEAEAAGQLAADEAVTEEAQEAEPAGAIETAQSNGKPDELAQQSEPGEVAGVEVAEEVDIAEAPTAEPEPAADEPAAVVEAEAEVALAEDVADEPATVAEAEAEVALAEDVAEEPATVAEAEAEVALPEDDAEEAVTVAEAEVESAPEAEPATEAETAAEPVAVEPELAAAPDTEIEPEPAAGPEPATEPEPAVETAAEEPREELAALPPAAEEAEPQEPRRAAVLGIDMVEVTDADRLILSGRADPGATVRFSVNDETLGEVFADASGAWTGTADLDLPPGRYVARAESVDEDGEVQARARLRFDRVRIAFAEAEAAEPEAEAVDASEAEAPPAAEAAESDIAEVDAAEIEPAEIEPAQIETAEAGLTEDDRTAAEAAGSETASGEAEASAGETDLVSTEHAAAMPAEPEAEPTEPAEAALPVAAEAGAESADATPEEGESIVAAADEPAADEPAVTVAARESAGVADRETFAAEIELAVAPAQEPESDGVEEGSVAPDTISIRRGDNLWRIARSIYGRGIEYRLIYEANRSQIRNPHLIYPGQVFTVPLPDEDDDPA